MPSSRERRSRSDPRHARRCAELGIDLVDLMPVGDPVAFTTQVGELIVPALAQLGR
jgi:hypothetical protein